MRGHSTRKVAAICVAVIGLTLVVLVFGSIAFGVMGSRRGPIAALGAIIFGAAAAYGVIYVSRKIYPPFDPAFREEPHRRELLDKLQQARTADDDITAWRLLADLDRYRSYKACWKELRAAHFLRATLAEANDQHDLAMRDYTAILSLPEDTIEAEIDLATARDRLRQAPTRQSSRPTRW